MRADIRALCEKSAREAGGGGGEYRRGICLACVRLTGKEDRRGSFSFNTKTGWYKCFKCAVNGRVDGFDEENYEDTPEEERPVMRPPDGFHELTRGDGVGATVLDAARDYLRGRGLRDERLWHSTHLGACTEGFYGGRVVVPVLSPDDAWLGFVARDWTKQAQAPYLYPKGMERRDILYNHRALLVGNETPVFVVEGVMDALALWPDAVAVLGKPSDPQVWALADAARPVVVCLDGDAWREGEQLALRLQLEGQRAGNVILPPKTDPDEVPLELLRLAGLRCLEEGSVRL